MIKQKKSVLGQVISVFILVLIISLLAGLTFLFTNEIKDETAAQVATTQTISGESTNGAHGVFLNETGYQLSAARNDPTSSGWTITDIYNASQQFGTDNVTVDSTTGIITNASSFIFEDSGARINYTHTSAANEPAYKAVNDTEDAGTTIVNYLPLVFIALIFGVILTVVLRIILPYVNLGQQMGGF